ncbi:uncharacterized protein BO97DRAFT_21087 [Aspergillus homomorphus CBS 101889]|uniref:ATPase AAA-type core domain-containing protein n=1 Tax=Aspergillus homomorphus (strain CBS 101889) TaxID=1450537 RepID=A0A395I1R5_ASPHC|nr:hypothetical protein BO97DRAFT_21087 [Aspergillus homomorphus CBS 101889]RAL14132.1 hypothetical protein BO97DRAFT_21087 [Aspergillus homomorphus CBS 101889]
MLLPGNHIDGGSHRRSRPEAAVCAARRRAGMTCGDVKHRLNTVLELAEKGDAVLLFDECDVFLPERSSSQLEQNNVVAVFLRGVMIMTSNRADTMDQAFQSRILLTMYYPDLDSTAREHIWRRCTSSQRASLC